MNVYIPYTMFAAALLLLGLCDGALLLRLTGIRARWMLLAALLPLAALVSSLGALTVLRSSGSPYTAFARSGMIDVLVVLLALLPALFAAVIILKTARWIDARRAARARDGESAAAGRAASGCAAEGCAAVVGTQAGTGPADPSRRRALKAGAALLPAVAAAAAIGGVGQAAAGTRVILRTVPVPGLPAELDGLRILHLSDLHLGVYVTLEDLDAILARAWDFAPELVALTGDVADDRSLLAPALERIGAFPAASGAWAVLGNHEYGRGLGKALRAFAAGPVPLLRGEGAAVELRGRRVWLAGLDDPAGIAPFEKRPDFYRRGLDGAMAGAGTGDWRLVLAHRPDVLPLAARRGASLVLAGHSHGGQIGMFGRSLFDPPGHTRPIWGVYRNGDARMHVTAGAGHWFPFRLGCPAEAPVLELRRA